MWRLWRAVLKIVVRCVNDVWVLRLEVGKEGLWRFTKLNPIRVLLISGIVDVVIIFSLFTNGVLSAETSVIIKLLCSYRMFSAT